MSDLDTNAETETTPSPPSKGRGAQSAVEQARRKLADAEGKSIYEWVAALGGVTPFKAQLYRTYPKIFRGKKVDGFLRSYDGEVVSEEEVGQEYQGGKYQMKILVPDQRGTFVFVTSRNFDIPGDPAPIVKMGEDPDRPAAAMNVEDPGVVTTALRMVEKRAEADQKRAEAAENRAHTAGALDPTLISLITEPFKTQMAMMERTISDLRAELKKEDPVQSRVLDKLVDGDNARITALQAQWSSERTMLLSQAAEDLKRAEARFDRTIDALTRAHEREIADYKQNYTFQIENVKLAHTTGADALKRENDHLRSELTAVKTELATIRAQKDEGPVDQLTKLAALKEAFDEVTGGKEETSGWEKAAEIIAPVASAIGQGISSRIQQAPPGAPGGPPPPGFVPQGQGARRRGRTVVRGPAPGAPAPQQQPPPSAAAPNGAVPSATPPVPAPVQTAPQAQQRAFSLDAQEVQLAITFIENAIANGTKPKEFAGSFRSLIPGDIIKAIRTLGVDAFLDQVQIPQGSRIDSVEGRAFVHDVARLLT